MITRPNDKELTVLLLYMTTLFYVHVHHIKSNKLKKPSKCSLQQRNIKSTRAETDPLIKIFSRLDLSQIRSKTKSIRHGPRVASHAHGKS